ncbi:MAG: metal-dependent transcriptional regulator [Ruminococcaceae bacterium]|nr:metal-dependent transcriptional regulator [Oscillospiraceae bacterium]
MQLQESAEMYLETIYILSKEKNIVRSIDVAEYMNYSKPSVSRAVGLLKNGGYVIMAEDGSLTLTELGKDVANKIFERHTILSKLLVHIGVSEDVAAKEACKIEHVISDDTLLKIKNFLKI